MDFIHSREFLNAGDTVILDCDTQCNFMVMSDSDFSSYRRGASHHYYGGFRTHFPTSIPVPHAGHWNIVIDLGGGRANIRYGLRVLAAA